MLTYALFPQIGLKFLENRNNPDAFEPVPTGEEATPAVASVPAKSADSGVYTITVNGQSYVVQVAEGGDISSVTPAAPVAAASAPVASAPVAGSGEPVAAPLAGNIWKIMVSPGQQVKEGDVLIILEAMKMETEIRAARDGSIVSVDIKEGDSVQVGDSLLTLA